MRKQKRKRTLRQIIRKIGPKEISDQDLKDHQHRRRCEEGSCP